MTETSSVDPRFDPVFQRGYDPAVHPRPAGSALAGGGMRRSVLDERPPVDGAPEPIVVPRFEAPPAKPVPPPVQQLEELESEPRNPWLVVLVVVSLVFLLAGGALLVSYGNLNMGYSSQSQIVSVVLQNLSYQLPPPLITVGLTGLVVRLVIAILWKSR